MTILPTLDYLQFPPYNLYSIIAHYIPPTLYSNYTNDSSVPTPQSAVIVVTQNTHAPV